MRDFRGDLQAPQRLLREDYESQRQKSEEMAEMGVRAMLGGLESGERWFLGRDVGEWVAYVLEVTRGSIWYRCALHLSVSGASGRSFGSA